MELSRCYLLMRLHDGSGACLACFREKGVDLIFIGAARIGEAVGRTCQLERQAHTRFTPESPLFPDQILDIHRG